VLQCIAVCCSVLQCGPIVLISLRETCNGKAFGVAVCCSVLQCVAVCCNGLISLKETCFGKAFSVAVCCSVLQCAAVCYSVLQRAHLAEKDLQYSVL